MALIFWDASALAKRYTAEDGRDTANAIFARASAHNMASTPWGYLETFSIIQRRFNSGVLNAATFRASLTALQAEVVQNPAFILLTISDAAIFSCTSTLQKHNLNATDSAILSMLLTYLAAAGRTDCILVACDRRLLRASEAEGITTINPQSTLPAELDAIFAASK